MLLKRNQMLKYTISVDQFLLFIKEGANNKYFNNFRNWLKL